MNQGITQAIVLPTEKFKQHQKTERIALFNPDGTPIGPTSDTGETLLLTGYESSLTEHPDNISSEDTANAAFAKLEARIAELEANVKPSK